MPIDRRRARPLLFHLFLSKSDLTTLEIDLVPFQLAERPKPRADVIQPGNPEDALTLDEMLDNIMLYWLPGTATSSARLYWECFAIGTPSVRLEIPVGVSIYPRETLRPSRR